MADFYPTRLADLIPWHVNYNTNAQATGTAQGLSAAQKVQITANKDAVIAIVNNAAAVLAFAQAVTDWRDIILCGPNESGSVPAYPTIPTAPTLPVGTLVDIEENTRGSAGILRANPLYTSDIGESYGISGVAPGDPTTPGVTAFALTASQVRLAIAKAGYDVVAVDSRINNGAWTQIGISMTAEYIDARPPLVAGAPEVREYRVQGMDNNARVGATSAVAKAVTVP